MKEISKFLKIFIYFISIIYFIYFFTSNPEIFYQLKSLKYSEILFLVLLRSHIFLLSALYLKEIISEFNIKISFLESLDVSNNSNLLNYFTPFRGGAGYRAIYFKNKYNLNFKNFSKTLIIYYLFTFIQCFVVFLICLINLNKFHYFFVIFILLTFVASIIFYRKNVFKNDLKLIFKMNKVLLKVFVIQLSLFFSFTVNNYLIFKYLNIPLTLSSVFMLTSVGVFSTLLSLTPGSVGIREAFFVYLNDLTNLSTFEIMQHALIDRSINIILLVFYFMVLKIFVSNCKS